VTRPLTDQHKSSHSLAATEYCLFGLRPMWSHTQLETLCKDSRLRTDYLKRVFIYLNASGFAQKFWCKVNALLFDSDTAIDHSMWVGGYPEWTANIWCNNWYNIYVVVCSAQAGRESI